jgi:hypothetical protein
MRAADPIEDLIAIDVYGDVFAEARDLLRTHHLDCAAILTRIGVENGLKRRARHEAMPEVDKAKASVVNDWLWKKGLSQRGSRHGRIMARDGQCLRARYPEKHQYTHRHVTKAIEDSQTFVMRL